MRRYILILILVLTACNAQSEPPTLTPTQAPTNTEEPTATLPPTHTPTATSTPIADTYPDNIIIVIPREGDDMMQRIEIEGQDPITIIREDESLRCVGGVVCITYTRKLLDGQFVEGDTLDALVFTFVENITSMTTLDNFSTGQSAYGGTLLIIDEPLGRTIQIVPPELPTPTPTPEGTIHNWPVELECDGIQAFSTEVNGVFTTNMNNDEELTSGTPLCVIGTNGGTLAHVWSYDHIFGGELFWVTTDVVSGYAGIVDALGDHILSQSMPLDLPEFDPPNFEELNGQ